MTRPAKKVTEALTMASSRRGFLRHLTRAAGTAAGGVAALLTTRSAHAAVSEKKVCHYVCLPHLTSIYKEVPAHRDCPQHWKGCVLF